MGTNFKPYTTFHGSGDDLLTITSSMEYITGTVYRVGGQLIFEVKALHGNAYICVQVKEVSLQVSEAPMYSSPYLCMS